MDHSPDSDPRLDALRRFSGIGRPLDSAWPTNRAIGLLAPLAGLVAFGVEAARSGPGAAAVGLGVAGAAALFGGWALGRELSPDSQATAFASALFSWLTIFFIPGAAVLPIFVALVAARVLDRTTGMPATAFDALSLVGLGVWAMWNGGGPLLGAVLVLVFAADGVLPNSNRWAWLGAVPMVGATLFAARGWRVPSLPEELLLPLAVLVLATARLVWRSGVIVSVADDTGEPLDPTRVRAGQIAVALIALAPLASTSGVETVGPLWGAVMGASLIRPGRSVGGATP